DIGRAVSGTLDLPQVLDLILDSLALIVNYDRASVLLESNNELEIVAARGYPPDSNPLNIRVKIKENDVYHTVYRTKEPFSVSEILDRPDWYQVKGLPQARSWAGLPLINAENDVIGMLSLTRELPHPYSADEIALGAAFAGQAAVALHNARLYMQLSDAYTDLEKLDRAKSDFITLVSHELRTPLTLLMGYSEMLVDNPYLGEDSQSHNMMDGIIRGGKRLYEIVERMIDMAEIDSDSLDLIYSQVNLPCLVREIVEDFKDALEVRQLALCTNGLEGLPPIYADRTQLKKVFYHLLMNGIKYTPDGGKVTIWGHAIPAEICGEMGSAVEILVQDEGVGIMPEAKEAIFDKFYRIGDVTMHSSGDVKFMGGGPGLGLAIVKGIVEAHHGKVWVESPGFDPQTCPGSTFHFILPIDMSPGDRYLTDDCGDS
ncbi:MAG: ATP-binding protein, partial [Anaerolineae bacterium]|nr:ATP-binding protein [Anaerolineae bacterium]